jgi:acyl carrier protein
MTPLTLEQARAKAALRQATTLKLKEALIDCFALDKEPADIPDDCLLFGVGLGLDSVDALEIVVAIESEFGLRVEDEHMKEIRSINSIVDLVISGDKLQSKVA